MYTRVKGNEGKNEDNEGEEKSEGNIIVRTKKKNEMEQRSTGMRGMSVEKVERKRKMRKISK